MTDQDRGAYTPPTDAPLSFDARQPVRGSRPAPFTLIASGFILILLVAAIVLFYRTGVRQAGQAPAAVGSPVGPLRAEAPVEAQPADPAAGLQIYKSEEGAETAAAPPKFIPPPETPAPRPAPTAPVASAKLPPAAPAGPAGLKPAPPIETQPKVATAPPPPKLPAKPAPTPAPAPAPKATAPVAAAPAGAFAVQIGAFSSQALADQGYVDAGRITGVDIAGKTKRVEPVVRNGSTLYRTTVHGFASRTQASAFCAELKAAGKPCFVK
jgi:hypothetical protein